MADKTLALATSASVSSRVHQFTLSCSRDSTVHHLRLDDAQLAALLERCSVVPNSLPDQDDLDTRAARLASRLLVGNHMHTSLQGGRVPDPQALFEMSRKLLNRVENRITWLVDFDDDRGAACQSDAENLFEQNLINLCTDCPGAPFFLTSLGVLLLNSWIREANRVVVHSKEALKYLTPEKRSEASSSKAGPKPTVLDKIS